MSRGTGFARPQAGGPLGGQGATRSERPWGRFCAASMRRPRVLASAVRISFDSKRRVSTSHTSCARWPAGPGLRLPGRFPSCGPGRPARANRGGRMGAGRFVGAGVSRTRAAVSFFGRAAGWLCRPARGPCPALPAAGPWARSPAPAPSRSASGRCSPAGARCRESRSCQPLQRRIGNALGLHAQLLGALLQEVARQHRDVFAPLAQRRQAQADHVEAVEQVLAEPPSLTRCSRSWWVAAITRTLALTALCPPTR
jgi:hypothetical protein